MKVSCCSETKTYQGEEGSDWMHDQNGREGFSGVRREIEIVIAAPSVPNILCSNISD
jgi:hypothetical protein